MNIINAAKARLHKVRKLIRHLTEYKWRGSADYWERNYKKGDTSGPGSYGRLAEFKAEVLNSFVKQHGVTRVVEWGCGDGNQLSLAQYPQYFGFDVSKTAVKMCRRKFKSDTTKSFCWTWGSRAGDALEALNRQNAGGGGQNCPCRWMLSITLLKTMCLKHICGGYLHRAISM